LWDVCAEGDVEMSNDILLSKALRAICLTRDYVGGEILPAIEGWEWYDAGMAISEAIPQDEWSEQFHARVKNWIDAHPGRVSTVRSQ